MTPVELILFCTVAPHMRVVPIECIPNLRKHPDKGQACFAGEVRCIYREELVCYPLTVDNAQPMRCAEPGDRVETWPPPAQWIRDYQITRFGKYKGMPLADLVEEDKDYCTWIPLEAVRGEGGWMMTKAADWIQKNNPQLR